MHPVRERLPGISLFGDLAKIVHALARGTSPTPDVLRSGSRSRVWRQQKHLRCHDRREVPPSNGSLTRTRPSPRFAPGNSQAHHRRLDKVEHQRCAAIVGTSRLAFASGSPLPTTCTETPRPSLRPWQRAADLEQATHVHGKRSPWRSRWQAARCVSQFKPVLEQFVPCLPSRRSRQKRRRPRSRVPRSQASKARRRRQ